MERQYDDASKETATKDATSQLCMNVLQMLFGCTDYKITPWYKFQDGYIAPFVVERIWHNDKGSPLLVVDVRCQDRTDDEDAEGFEDFEADTEIEQYADSAISQTSNPGQLRVFAARWVGVQLMLYVFTAQQKEAVAMAENYMDVKYDYAAIRGLVRKVQEAKLF